MRIRAGIVLIQDHKVALIERHRAGLSYFVFPGGGVDEGESPEQAAIREAMEELGIEVAIRQKVAEIQLGQKSRQVYFLVEQTDGIVLSIVRTEAVGADHFREPVRLVRRGHVAAPAHLRQAHAHAGFGKLPSGFGPGETAADDVNVERHCAFH